MTSKENQLLITQGLWKCWTPELFPQLGSLRTRTWSFNRGL